VAEEEVTGDRTRPKMRAVASKHQKERRKKRKVMEREVVAAAWWGGVGEMARWR